MQCTAAVGVKRCCAVHGRFLMSSLLLDMCSTAITSLFFVFGSVVTIRLISVCPFFFRGRAELIPAMLDRQVGCCIQARPHILSMF